MQNFVSLTIQLLAISLFQWSDQAARFIRPLDIILHSLPIKKSKLKYYFTLQFIRIKRWFEEIGINPSLGITIITVLFVLLSKYIFLRTEFAGWIYPLFAIMMVLNLGEKSRNKQLKNIYNRTNQIAIRVLENGITVLPFLLYLLYEQQLLQAIILLGMSVLLASINIDINLNKVLPTPFKKIPFENIVGFRKSLLPIGILYFLIGKGIQVDNYNLCIVSFGSIFIILMSFYLKPEKKYYVWIFARKTVPFLKEKLINAIICATILVAPAILCLGFFFPDRVITSIVVFIVGIVFLTSMIFAKYSAYPNEMNIPQGILYGLSLWFPPMLLIAIPIFYKQSKRNLKSILE